MSKTKLVRDFQWWGESRVIDGVRMGPPFPTQPKAEPRRDEEPYKLTVINNGLVSWLRRQGADKFMVHDFHLSKGMGERLELLILNNDVVEMRFYGQPPASPPVSEGERQGCHRCGGSGKDPEQFYKDGKGNMSPSSCGECNGMGSSESPVPAHEFVGEEPGMCWYIVPNAKDRCGQPRSSPVHTEAPAPEIKKVTCPVCHGDGINDYPKQHSCENCNGDGIVRPFRLSDPARFLERGFTFMENQGHSIRLINRDNVRQAISIAWDDLPALRELITFALDDVRVPPTAQGDVWDRAIQIAKEEAFERRMAYCVLERLEALRK